MEQRSSGVIDTREYEDWWLLAKILVNMNLKEDEKELLKKHFKKE